MSVEDVIKFRNEFKKKYPEFKNIPYRIAVNHNIVSGNTLLNDGDEDSAHNRRP